MKYYLTFALTLFMTYHSFSQQLEVEGDAIIDGKIMSVTDPTEPQDAATKAYVDRLTDMMLDAGLNGLVEDIDGNIYRTIKIGGQIWMADNLKATRYNNGTSVALEESASDWANLTSPAYCWYFNDSTAHSDIYGALYNYFVVSDTNSLNVCPTGWHVPTDSSWTVLVEYLEDNSYGFGGSGSDIAKALASSQNWASSGTTGAIGNDSGTNNLSGFNAHASGIRTSIGSYIGKVNSCQWWSSSSSDPTSAWNYMLSSSQSVVSRPSSSKKRGFSIRCLED